MDEMCHAGTCAHLSGNQRCICTQHQSRTSVEAIPSQPQDEGASAQQHLIVGTIAILTELLFLVALFCRPEPPSTGSNDQSANEGTNPCAKRRRFHVRPDRCVLSDNSPFPSGQGSRTSALQCSRSSGMPLVIGEHQRQRPCVEEMGLSAGLTSTDSVCGERILSTTSGTRLCAVFPSCWEPHRMAGVVGGYALCTDRYDKPSPTPTFHWLPRPNKFLVPKCTAMSTGNWQTARPRMQKCILRQPTHLQSSAPLHFQQNRSFHWFRRDRMLMCHRTR